MLLLDALPLIVLVVLLAIGRTEAVVSCLIAMLCALPALALARAPGEGLAALVGTSALQGAWLAVPPIAIVAGGLLLHASLPAVSVGRAEGDVGEQLFTAAFLLGPFIESVTGFGVGMVFALGVVRTLGVRGTPAAAIALVAQMAIPWGGLAPGTSLGAALANVSGQMMARHNAFMAAPWFLVMLALFWRFAAAGGVTISGAERLRQAGWVVALGAMLIGAHYVAPFEVCGVLATGPLLAIRLWRAHPPRDAEDWRAALGAVAPYVLLTGALLLSRLWGGAPRWQPYPALPALPLNHTLFVLWAVALLLLARNRDAAAAARAAMHRAGRPALAILAYVVLSRLLVASGAPVALAIALATTLGQLAPFSAPLLAGMSGFFTGSNVASNSMMMTTQVALGAMMGTQPMMLPSVQNFSGSAAMMLSPQAAAIATKLAGGAARPSGVWKLAWPAFVANMVIGVVAIWLA